jgi:hypothetical protein
LKINAANKTITLHQPVLPSFLNDITITNLRVNNQLIIFQVRRNKDGIEATLLSPNKDITIAVQNKVALDPVLSPA